MGGQKARSNKCIPSGRDPQPFPNTVLRVYDPFWNSKHVAYPHPYYSFLGNDACGSGRNVYCHVLKSCGEPQLEHHCLRKIYTNIITYSCVWLQAELGSCRDDHHYNIRCHCNYSNYYFTNGDLLPNTEHAENTPRP